MSFLQYPEILYARVLSDDEVLLAGGFTVPENQQLSNIVMDFYQNGDLTGDERLRLKLYHDKELTNLYATGDWATVSDFTDDHSYWIGRVRFDFASLPWLQTDQRYYVAIESDSYVRNGDTFYLSFLLDWPFPVNDNTNALRMSVYAYRNVAY